MLAMLQAFMRTFDKMWWPKLSPSEMLHRQIYTSSLTQFKLEQLERLRSENTHRRPMITHTIDSFQIPNQENMEIMQAEL